MPNQNVPKKPLQSPVPTKPEPDYPTPQQPPQEPGPEREVPERAPEHELDPPRALELDSK